MRKRSIEKCIRGTGAYTHTFDELEFGARQAWRNAPRCIGRILWNNLKAGIFTIPDYPDCLPLMLYLYCTLSIKNSQFNIVMQINFVA